MPTFMSTVTLTDDGVANIRNTIDRSEQFKTTATQLGVTVTQVYWTLGSIDGFLIMDAPDEETVTTLMLYLATQGNVETETFRAFDASEMSSIIERMPNAS